MDAENFKQFIKLSPDAVFIHSQGEILLANEVASILLGGSSSRELLGQDLFRFIHAEDHQLVKSRVDRLHAGLSPVGSTEMKFLHFDGRTIDVEVNSALIDFSGKPAVISFFRDIRSRKRTEAALKESEENYRYLFDNIALGIGVADETGRIITFNEAMLRPGGYSHEDITKIEHISQLYYDPDERDKIMDLARAQGFVDGVEVRFKRKDQTPYDALLSLRPIKIKGRRHWCAMLLDITKRKRAERILKLSEAKFYNAFKSNPGAISISRLADGRYIEINQGFTNMYGYTREEAIGRTNAELGILGSHLEQIDRRKEALQKQGTIYDLEFTFRRKNGETGVGLNNAELIHIDDQPHILSMSIDITARKRAEGALRESEQRFRELAELLPEIVCEIDLKGRLTFVNQKALEISGYTREDFERGLEAVNLMAPADRPKAIKNISRVLSGEKDLSEEYFAQKKDGRQFPVMIRSTPIVRQGQVQGLRSILFDVSERRKVEEQHRGMEEKLMQSQKMEAIGTLASGIAHDFNNILQAISGSVQLILAKEAVGQNSRKYLVEIDRAVERASDLVHRLLTFSRKVEPERKPVDLNLAVVQAVKLLERTIPKMISIETHLAEDLHNTSADPHQLERALINLGTNARDAMPEGGRMIIETSNIFLDDDFCRSSLNLKPGNYLLLKFSDTGQGMNKETVGRIFEPFFTTKGLGEGTGLGLSTVYGIVKGHEGHISCYSELGQGTTFNIYLPASLCASARETSLAAGWEEDSPGGRETILLVDDEMTILETAKDILKSKGYEVLTADSGEEAVKVYGESGRAIDLVILDLGMPGMGGQECLRRILTINHQAMIIIASGYSINGQVQETLEAGARDFISKPYSLRNLLQTVRGVLDERPDITA